MKRGYACACVCIEGMCVSMVGDGDDMWAMRVASETDCELPKIRNSDVELEYRHDLVRNSWIRSVSVT
jgi:hypothetical protein